MKISPKVTETTGPLPEEIVNGTSSLEMVTLSEYLSQEAKVSTLVFVDNLTSQEVVENIVKGKIDHLVQWNDKFFFKQIQMIKSVLENPRNAVTFGASLTPGAEESLIISFSADDDKASLKEKVCRIGEGLHSSVEESLISIFEELYMNATLDAPREWEKMGLGVSADPDWAAEFIAESNEDFILLACRDPFGSLDTDKFIDRMNEVYEKGAGEAINQGEGGAGLGCIILFEHSLSLILAVERGSASCVGALIPKKMNHRLKAGLRKSLHKINL